ncbi:MAG: recombinase [Sulfurovum sp.]|nr:MAG: recombinase [Sulfurovum sp.]
MKTPQRIARDLSQPFGMNSLEWRVQQVGGTPEKIWIRVLAYITARDIQQRLDEVVGAFSWKNEFTTLPNSIGDGAMCGASIKHDGEWITKWNGAENTQIEPIKGGLSSAEKRAWVEWGIGRYLYEVDNLYAEVISQEIYNNKSTNKKEYTRATYKDKKKNKDIFVYWKPPTLSEKFRPQPFASKDIKKNIEKLAGETKTTLDELLLLYFGVNNVHDLYKNEASIVVDLLIKVKTKQEDKKDEK